MHWQNLDTIDWLVMGAIALAFLAVIPLYRSDMRLRRNRYADWHHAYFREGGLIRQLMARWLHGTARLTDERRGREDDSSAESSVPD